MKKLILSSIFIASGILAQAQTMYLCKDGDYTTKEVTQGLEIDLTQGYDSITFTKPQIEPTVTIVYNGSSATVKKPSFVTGVSSTINGANVVITSDNVTEEIKYIVSGTSSNGSLTINGSYKLSLELAGLDLTSATGAALDIECGKRINLILADGKTNSLSDAASGSQKACFYCKGHLEVSGAGTLNVSGNKSHAISTKEYMQMKKTAGTINIVKAANDALHVGQYFQMNGGKISITSTTVGDGIQAESTSDAKDENNGQIIIKGGTLDITMANQDTKAIKADTDITISGGSFTINAEGNGSRGIQTDGNMTIGEEENATSILINATGGKCTLAECAQDPHNCMGIKVDGNLTINKGKVSVYNTGKKSKGIKVGGTYTANGGTISAVVESTN